VRTQIRRIYIHHIASWWKLHVYLTTQKTRNRTHACTHVCMHARTHAHACLLHFLCPNCICHDTYMYVRGWCALSAPSPLWCYRVIPPLDRTRNIADVLFVVIDVRTMANGYFYDTMLSRCRELADDITSRSTMRAFEMLCAPRFSSCLPEIQFEPVCAQTRYLKVVHRPR